MCSIVKSQLFSESRAFYKSIGDTIDRSQLFSESYALKDPEHPTIACPLSFAQPISHIGTVFYSNNCCAYH